MYWLRRALGIATAGSLDDSKNETATQSDHDEFPDDPTTDSVPLPISVDVELEQ